eukprot:TRINITY_DN19580_c0_g1_i1.p1 TRINITY_DN19580_c0_g1~~TRINITY_DN19580_c0_g1_i1.p1  ORF type:complete len:496 (-),score=74.56 TRINITY_DN19580_c0_g1_i1:220-1623(-)
MTCLAALDTSYTAVFLNGMKGAVLSRSGVDCNHGACDEQMCQSERWCRLGKLDARNTSFCYEGICTAPGDPGCSGPCCAEFFGDKRTCEDDFDTSCVIPDLGESMRTQEAIGDDSVHLANAVSSYRNFSDGAGEATVSSLPPPRASLVWEPSSWCRQGRKSHDPGIACDGDTNNTRRIPMSKAPSPGNPDHVHVAYASSLRSFFSLMNSVISLISGIFRPEHCTVHLVVGNSDWYAAKKIIARMRQFLRPTHSLPSVVLHALRPVRFNLLSLLKSCQRCRGDLVVAQNFVRFYLHEYLPEVDRVIWLDTDTLIRADVRALHEMRFDSVVAAAPDHTLRQLSDLAEIDHRLRSMLGRANSSSTLGMFNPGVFVIDLFKWKSLEITGKLEAWINSHIVKNLFKVGFTQPALNIVFFDSYHVLGQEWNVQNPKANSDETQAGNILHWSGRRKPWHRLPRGTGLSIGSSAS